jgi:predicted dehydrogenase
VSVDRKLWNYDIGVTPEVGFGSYESMGDFQWRTRAGDIVVPHVTLVEPLLAEVEAFGEACTTGEPPLTDGRHGVEVVRVLHAIERSARSHGASVRVGA